MAPLRYAAKFDPFLSLDCAPTPSTLAQSKERKGSNFAIWHHWRKAGTRDFSEKLHLTSLKSNRFSSPDQWRGERLLGGGQTNVNCLSIFATMMGRISVIVILFSLTAAGALFIPVTRMPIFIRKAHKKGTAKAAYWFSGLNPLGPWQYELQSLAMRVNDIMHINQTSRPPARRLWAPWRPRAGWCRRASTGCRQSWAGAARTRVKCRVK